MPASTAETDKQLFNRWKNATGVAKEQALGDLLNNFSGAVMTAVNSFTGAPLPQVTMKLEAMRYAKEAFETYDPVLSGNLTGYLITSIKQKLYRYVSTYQNVARIPEHQIGKIAPLRTAMADLTQQFGREPTTAELSDHMGVSVTRLAQLRRVMRRDLLEEGGGGIESLETFEHDPAYEKAMLAYYSLNDVEKQVFDYSLGAHGQVQLTNNAIATKLKLSAARVSQIKKHIADVIKPYLGN